MIRQNPPFEIKSASITGMALVLKTAEMDPIVAELALRVQDAGDLFLHAPMLIDVSALVSNGVADELDLARLVTVLAGHDMRAVGIVGAAGDLLNQASKLGLVEEIDFRPRQRPRPAEPDIAPIAASTTDQTVPQGSSHAGVPCTVPTMVLDKPLRSGQRVYARGGDLVVLGVVSHGAEVIADGHIHIYGPLRGRAIAGAQGDAEARIFASSMEPELISIAGTYRTTDKPLAADVLGKPACARLDGDKLLILPLRN